MQGRGRKQKPETVTVRRGHRREVTAGEMDHPVTVETFTIPEAAEALGKSLATFRKWIADSMIPSPYLSVTQSGYKVYSKGELEIIAQELNKHGQEFSYFRADHSTVIHEINQRIQGYRAMHV